MLTDRLLPSISSLDGELRNSFLIAEEEEEAVIVVERCLEFRIWGPSISLSEFDGGRFNSEVK